MMATSTEAQKH